MTTPATTIERDFITDQFARQMIELRTRYRNLKKVKTNAKTQQEIDFELGQIQHTESTLYRMADRLACRRQVLEARIAEIFAERRETHSSKGAPS